MFLGAKVGSSYLFV